MVNVKKLTAKSVEILLSEVNKGIKDPSKISSDIEQAYKSHLSGSFKPMTDNMDRVNLGSYQIGEDVIKQLNFNCKPTDDFENVKSLYTALRNLTPQDANDKRLWVRLTHDSFHRYVVNRWFKEDPKKTKTFQVVKERYFFEGASQRARVSNAISRLWWIGKLTVIDDASSEEIDQWKYTELICDSQDWITSLLERRLGAYRNVRFGVLDYYSKNKTAFSSGKSGKIQFLLKALNNYGGVSVISNLDQLEIEEICDRIMQVYK